MILIIGLTGPLLPAQGAGLRAQFTESWLRAWLLVHLLWNGDGYEEGHEGEKISLFIDPLGKASE